MRRAWIALLGCGLALACARTREPPTRPPAVAPVAAPTAPAQATHQPNPAPAVPPSAAPASKPAQPARTVLPATLGGARPAALFVPTAYDPARRWPLVILLHGYGAAGASQADHLGLVRRVEARGFVLLAPDGTPDRRGARFWNASPSCCDFDGQGVDDVGYVAGLIAEARAALSLDPERVVLVGVSNGGFLAHRLACEAADLITGIASIGGSMAEGATCTPSRPVPVLLVHGTADALVRFDGGAYGGGAPYQGIGALGRGWAERDGCGVESVVAPRRFDLDARVPGDETERTAWPGCATGARVELWALQGSPHIPAFSDAFADALLDWLLRP